MSRTLPAALLAAVERLRAEAGLQSSADHLAETAAICAGE